MVRGTGKFKTKRGGGRNFNWMVLDKDGIAAPRSSRGENTWRVPSTPKPELTRAERRELKKQAARNQAIDEDDEDADLINPNHVKKKLNIDSNLESRELTRMEREAKAEEHYWKLHCAGKTAEAKSDLARLTKIREERETAQAKREAEAEAKAAEIEAKKKASVARKRMKATKVLS